MYKVCSRQGVGCKNVHVNTCLYLFVNLGCTALLFSPSWGTFYQLVFKTNVFLFLCCFKCHARFHSFHELLQGKAYLSASSALSSRGAARHRRKGSSRLALMGPCGVVRAPRTLGKEKAVMKIYGNISMCPSSHVILMGSVSENASHR